jgi:membrane associated rhomboid family serine protease
MIPVGDDLPTVRTPIMTYLILATLVGVWIFVQGAGVNEVQLATSICNLGLVPGEITHMARLGTAVPLGNGMACVVDNDPINLLTPLFSIFLHGGWWHLLGNCLFLWVFGNNIEDSMGHVRFLVFFLICGLVAGGAQVISQPVSPVPTVGASGAISGVLGAYLVLYPRVRVRMLFVFFILSFPAWAVLLWWFGWQLLSALPGLMEVRPDVSSGVAVWAHIGGFVTGLVLVKLFENPNLVARRSVAG